MSWPGTNSGSKCILECGQEGWKHVNLLNM